VRPEFDPAVSRAGRHTQDLIGDLRACARRAAGRSASLSRHPSKRKHPNLPAHSTYTPEIGQKIARLMCDETLTLKEACAKAEAPYSTVMKWKDSHPEFELEISRARAALADGLYQDIRRVEHALEDGSLEPDIARTLINSKQWAITKFGPKDWGDRKFLEGNVGGTVKVEHTRKLSIDGLTIEQLDALEGALKATVLQLDAPKEEEN
jgi:hypothetical protein